MTKALYVPADETKPARLVEIGGTAQQLGRLQSLVGGSVQCASFDTDADIWVNEEGRGNGLEGNLRATDYALTESEAAKEGRTRGREEWYSLYGDVVITGAPDEDNYATDVPQRFIDRFGLSIDNSIGPEL